MNIVEARQAQKTLLFVTGELHHIVDRTKLRALDFETVAMFTNSQETELKFQCICLPKNSHFSYTKIDPIYCDKQLVQPKLYSLKEGFYPCQPEAFVEG